MALIKRRTFFDVTPGSDLEVTISNAGDRIQFFAELIEDQVTVADWEHDELWNNTAIAVITGHSRNRFELTGVFAGADSFDLEANIVEDGEVTQTRTLTGLTDGDAVRVLISCFMTEDE